MTNLQKIKTTVNVLAVAVSVGFIDGLLNIGFSDDLYLFIGLIIIAATIYLLKLVHGKQDNE